VAREETHVTSAVTNDISKFPPKFELVTEEQNFMGCANSEGS
jgi:hypothetical protein